MAAHIDTKEGQRAPSRMPIPISRPSDSSRTAGSSTSSKASRKKIAAWQRRPNLYRLVFHSLQRGISLKGAVEDPQHVAKTDIPRIRDKLVAS
jgi:hypothetical protein